MPNEMSFIFTSTQPAWMTQTTTASDRVENGVIEMPDNEYIECSNCLADLHYTDDWYGECGRVHCDECGGNVVCYDCHASNNVDDDYDDDDRAGGRIHNYSYRPLQWMPKGNVRNNPAFGIELEVGRSAQDIADVAEVFDPDESHIYLKEDGSITGAEIVTHPMTLAWCRREGRFDTLLRELRDVGCEVDRGYGLHIHVSRSAFNAVEGYGDSRRACHQMTWLLFIYRNTDAISRLARRDNSQWASFDYDRPPRYQGGHSRPWRHSELKRKAISAPYMSERYTAVNCNNRDTFELRFFQSTLDPQEFHAAIEFADASVRYTRELRASDILRNKGLSWEAFTNWVVARNYPSLINEIAGGLF